MFNLNYRYPSLEPDVDVDMCTSEKVALPLKDFDLANEKFFKYYKMLSSSYEVS